MTKRKEIKEGIAQQMFNAAHSGVFKDMHIHVRAGWYSEADKLLQYLRSKGCVIGGPLPSVHNGKGEMMTALEYKKKLERLYEPLVEE